MPGRYRLHLSLSTALLFALASGAGGASDEGIRLRTFKTHSRLAFPVDQGVKADIRNTREGFVLLLKGIGLVDLGAPLADEAKWAKRFEQLNDTRISGLRFSESADGVRVEGKWKYPAGAQALAYPAMEWFDFREKEPAPQYVLDFWVKQGPTLAEVRAAAKQAARLADLKKQENEGKRRADRRLAAEKRRAEAQSIEKFCDQPLSDQNDIFVGFSPVHERVDFSRWLPNHMPDRDFTYPHPKSKEKDAQYVRLALDLYKQSKPALVVRTIEFFESEHPKSELRFDMRLLKANAMIRLGLTAEAERILEQLTQDAPKTQAALQAGRFLAGKRAAAGAQLAALERFLWLIEHHGGDKQAWVYHLGAAEAMYSLKQTDRAAREYQWIAEHAGDDKSRSEGALRLGDVFMERAQFAQALAAYYQALGKFGEQAKKVPPVHLNRAEALYQLGELDRARDAYKEALDLHGGYPSAWRASFRLGEIEGRRADAPAQQASRKWFYETINRYPFSAGSVLARLRLLPCGDHGGFDADSSLRFFTTEAAQFDGRGEVLLEDYPEMRGISRVRSLITFDRHEAAVEAAVEEIRDAGGSAKARQVIGGALGNLFRKTVLSLLDQGRKLEALAFYRDKSRAVPAESNPVDPDYLLKLSQTASDLGLGTLGQELADEYTKATKRLAVTGRNVASADIKDIKDVTDPEAQLADSERAFAEAKALWVSQGMAAAAKVREQLGKVREESRYSFEREVILGLIAEHEEKLPTALAHALKAQLLLPTGEPSRRGGAPSHLASDLRIDCWVASLQARVGDPKIALIMFRNLETHLLDQQKSGKPASASSAAAVLGVPASPEPEQLLITQARIHEKLGQWGEAAGVYSRGVEQGLGGTQVRYGYAQALLKAGRETDRAKAIAALEDLAGPTVKPVIGPDGKPVRKQEDFWKTLARETLADEKSKQAAKGTTKEGSP